jgi:hypothetical protein
VNLIASPRFHEIFRAIQLGRRVLVLDSLKIQIAALRTSIQPQPGNFRIFTLFDHDAFVLPIN